MWEPLGGIHRGWQEADPHGPARPLELVCVACAQRGWRLAPGRCPGAGLLLPALWPPLLASSGFLSPTQEAAPGLLSLASAALCGTLLLPKPPILAPETPSFIPETCGHEFKVRTVTIAFFQSHLAKQAHTQHVERRSNPGQGYTQLRS